MVSSEVIDRAPAHLPGGTRDLRDARANRTSLSKVMYYCHDTFGLGHLRRSLTLARHLRERTPSLSQLLVTGSPVAQSFPLPEGADFVKLPSVVKMGAGRYEARSISAPFSEILFMRGEMLLSAARHFRPEALVIDHAPAGLKGEALETLRYLKRNLPATRLIIGLRDVLDEASTVRRAWSSEGVYELLDDLYDLILVYGQRDVYDVVEEYGLSARAAAKTRYLGYLRRPSGGRTLEEVRAELGTRTDRLVVVTTGGGDGAELLGATVEALRLKSSTADYDSLLIGGPLMPKRDHKRLLDAADPNRGIHVLPFTTDMTSYMGPPTPSSLWADTTPSVSCCRCGVLP